MKSTAIVTGSAKGIGKAIALKLISDGYFILAIDMDEEEGKRLESETGIENLMFVKADVSKTEDVSYLYNIVKEKHDLQLLVNNAGIVKDNMIWKMPEEDFDSVISVNLKGVWLMCRDASTIMKEKGKGKIVNISSRAWLGDNRGQSNYVSSKAGIVGLTRVLAVELGRFGINVNCVAPGLIQTPLTLSLPETTLNELIQKQPAKRMGTPEDIAHAVSFLASENSSFITGQVIHVDGGRSVGSLDF
jgi:3-oxoacyl-[acyl-carrier protein] reductase